MYNEHYRKLHEIQGMYTTLNNTADTRPSPAEELQIKEEKQIARMAMRKDASPDERILLDLIEALLDASWKIPTMRALRGELRRMWLSEGASKERYYKAFKGLKQRRTA